MSNTLKVFVFINEECLVAEKGHFDQWCAFAETEAEAQITIQVRYRLGGIRLKLVETLEDRRKKSCRREWRYEP